MLSPVAALLLLSTSALALSGHNHGGFRQHPRRQQAGPDALPADLEVKVKARLAETATDSWVSGTRAEALLERDYPELSVYSPTYTKMFTSEVSDVPQEVSDIASYWDAKRPDNSTALADGDGAAGDPAAIGIAFIVAAATDPNVDKAHYLDALKQQSDHLTTTVPRLDDGTISQREAPESVQLWDDFVYMAPPFLAIWGVYTQNQTLVKEAYNQCRLYRQHMQDPETMLWRHILLGDWQDKPLWGTGMGWATAGMARVAATIKNSQYSAEMAAEISDLTNWSLEIIRYGSGQVDTTNYLLPNEYYSTNGTFTDGASSSLIASTIYRLAQMNVLGAEAYVPQADRIRHTIYNDLDKQTGWLQHVVDPLDWYVQISKSPEAQAFVLLMEAAFAGYTESKGQTAAVAEVPVASVVSASSSISATARVAAILSASDAAAASAFSMVSQAAR